MMTVAELTWTTDKPTVPGWYWYRMRKQVRDQYLLGVHGFGDQMRGIWPNGQSEPVMRMPGEWFDPLEQPK